MTAFYKGMLVDEELGQPLVKSLVEGEFYYPKDEMLSRSRKVGRNALLCMQSMSDVGIRRRVCEKAKICA